MALAEVLGATDRFMAVINPYLTRLLIAVIILLVGFIIGRILGKIIETFLESIGLDSSFKETSGLRFSITNLLSKSVSIVIYAGSAVLAFSTLGLKTILFNLLMAVLLFTIGVSFLLSLKDFFPNLFAGLKIKWSGKIREGMTLSTAGDSGEVEEVNLLNVVLSPKKEKGEKVIIPSSLLLKKKVSVKKEKS